MADFINTIDELGDDVTMARIIERSIIEFKDDVLTEVGMNSFSTCYSLLTIDLPNVSKISSNAFTWCKALTTVNIPSCTRLGNYSFDYCSTLKSVVISISTSTLCVLENKDAFRSSGIANGTGYIYVPRNLIDSYKSASNWSTYANQFRAIEDYTVDGTITGELDPTKI